MNNRRTKNETSSSALISGAGGGGGGGGGVGAGRVIGDPDRNLEIHRSDVVVVVDRKRTFKRVFIVDGPSRCRLR